MIVLNEKDQDSLLDMKELISEVEIAFENYSKNQTVTPIRYSLPFHKGNRF